jgi:hypothetical protein
VDIGHWAAANEAQKNSGAATTGNKNQRLGNMYPFRKPRRLGLDGSGQFSWVEAGRRLCAKLQGRINPSGATVSFIDPSTPTNAGFTYTNFLPQNRVGSP